MITVISDKVSDIIVKSASIRAHIQAQNFARLAFHGHLHGAAADFAIRGEPLRGLAGVYQHFKFPPAKWALNEFGFLHKTYGAPGMRLRRRRRVVDTFIPGWLTVKCSGTVDALFMI
jgi:hypothetical protein